MGRGHSGVTQVSTRQVLFRCHFPPSTFQWQTTRRGAVRFFFSERAAHQSCTPPHARLRRNPIGHSGAPGPSFCS